MMLPIVSKMNSTFIIFAAFFVVAVVAQKDYSFCKEDKECEEGQYCAKCRSPIGHGPPFLGLCRDYQDEGELCDGAIAPRPPIAPNRRRCIRVYLKCKPGLQCLPDNSTSIKNVKTCQIPHTPTTSTPTIFLTGSEP